MVKALRAWRDNSMAATTSQGSLRNSRQTPLVRPAAWPSGAQAARVETVEASALRTRLVARRRINREGGGAGGALMGIEHPEACSREMVVISDLLQTAATPN